MIPFDNTTCLVQVRKHSLTHLICRHVHMRSHAQFSLAFDRTILLQPIINHDKSCDFKGRVSCSVRKLERTHASGTLTVERDSRTLGVPPPQRSSTLKKFNKTEKLQTEVTRPFFSKNLSASNSLSIKFNGPSSRMGLSRRQNLRRKRLVSRLTSAAILLDREARNQLRTLTENSLLYSRR